jgi:hypothetical protein
MLQNILKMDGAKKLNKNEQKNISGGARRHYSLCIFPVEYCANERVYDPCGPITNTNYPC